MNHSFGQRHFVSHFTAVAYCVLWGFDENVIVIGFWLQYLERPLVKKGWCNAKLEVEFPGDPIHLWFYLVPGVGADRLLGAQKGSQPFSNSRFESRIYTTFQNLLCEVEFQSADPHLPLPPPQNHAPTYVCG